MPSKMSEAHSRQLALYSKAFPEKEVWCDYVTPKQAVSYKLSDPEPKLKEIIKISLGLMKFLSISDDASITSTLFIFSQDFISTLSLSGVTNKIDPFKSKFLKNGGG